MSEQMKSRSLKDRILGIDNLGVILIVLVFALVVIAFSGGKFFTVSNITSLLRSVAVTGIMACAVTLVMITANIDLSLGWMVGLAACITGVHSHSIWEALLLAMLACGLCGFINGLLVGGLKLNAFIATLGTMYAYKGVTMLYADGKLLTASNFDTKLQWLGQGEILRVPVPVWLLLIVAVLFWFLLKKTTFGTKIYAVGANPVASRFSGIASGKIIILVYTLAGLATGLAGVVFYSKVMSTQAYSGAGLEFSVLTAIVLGGTSVTGGKGSVWGTILGVVFMGVLSNGFDLMNLSSNIQYLVQGIILVIAIRADVMRTGGVKKLIGGVKKA